MTSRITENSVKKGFMVWIWRVQQVALLLTLAMTALNLSIQIGNKIVWRFGSIYIAVALSLVVSTSVILFVGYLWDRKARMWHEQSIVTVERNPFNLIRMTPKELVMYSDLFIPIVESLGPEHAKRVAGWKKWIDDLLQSDPVTKEGVDMLRERYFDESRKGKT